MDRLGNRRLARVADRELCRACREKGAFGRGPRPRGRSETASSSSSCGVNPAAARVSSSFPGSESANMPLFFMLSSASSAKSGNTGLKTEAIPDSGTRTGITIATTPRETRAASLSARTLSSANWKALSPSTRSNEPSSHGKDLDVADSKIALGHPLGCDLDQLLRRVDPGHARPTIRDHPREATGAAPTVEHATVRTDLSSVEHVLVDPRPPALRCLPTSPPMWLPWRRTAVPNGLRCRRRSGITVTSQALDRVETTRPGRCLRVDAPGAGSPGAVRHLKRPATSLSAGAGPASYSRLNAPVMRAG